MYIIRCTSLVVILEEFATQDSPLCPTFMCYLSLLRRASHIQANRILMKEAERRSGRSISQDVLIRNRVVRKREDEEYCIMRSSIICSPCWILQYSVNNKCIIIIMMIKSSRM